jgi:hypothetical protein
MALRHMAAAMIQGMQIRHTTCIAQLLLTIYMVGMYHMHGLATCMMLDVRAG